MTIARLNCWGDFRVCDFVTGADISPRGRKARGLLAYLTLHRDKPVSRERLAGLLWGDRSEHQARLSLRQTIFELKHLRGGQAPPLLVERDRLTLRSAAVVTDIDELVALADRGDHEALLRGLPESDETLFANLDGIDAGFDDWLAIERARQSAALLTLIGDALTDASAAGKSRIARRLQARLAEYGEGTPTLAIASLSLPPAPTGATDGAAGKTRLTRSGMMLAAAALLGTAAFAVAAPGLLQAPLPSQASFEASKSAEAASLFRTARGLIYKRDGTSARVAADLLHRSVALDPGFAPALSSLASVTVMLSTDGTGAAEAEPYARRALALRPDLAQTHAALGMVLGFRGREAGVHLRRAVAIDPSDAEAQFWLSNYLANSLAFEQRLATLRRAVAIAPLWPRAVNQAAIAAWTMGFPEEADRYVRRLAASNSRSALGCDDELEFLQGHFSKIIKRALSSRDNSTTFDQDLGFAFVAVGRIGAARVLLRLPDEDWTLISGGAPTIGQSRRLFARRNTTLASRLIPALRRELLASGRAKDLVALYAGSDELAGDADDDRLFDIAPDMAVALRDVGRTDEAAALLRRADAIADRVVAGERMPNWFSAELAQLRAVEGRDDEAISALRRAVDGGWIFWSYTSNSDIGRIAAFRGLRKNAAFEDIRADLRAGLERERLSIS